MFYKLALAGALAIWWADHADAMTYSFTRQAGNDIVVSAAGEIEDDEGWKFGAFIQKFVPEGLAVKSVSLNSRGGDVSGAAALAYYIRTQGWSTTVPAGGVCASACVMLWASGRDKHYADPSWIGVHQARNGDSNDVNKLATDLMVGILNFNGMPEDLKKKLYETPPTDVHWLDEKELKAWSASKD